MIMGNTNYLHTDQVDNMSKNDAKAVFLALINE